jgi:Domain of unknown function (DUF929)
MGKGDRKRAASARERIAAQQEAARKAEQRRKTLAISGSIGLVLVIVVGLIFAKTLFSSAAKQQGTGHLPASVATAVTTVPTGTLASIGTGALAGVSSNLKTISDTALTSAGKPEMLYIGAEFCPYCAAMRWSMAVALSRFGTFGPFTGIHSSSSDVYPNTATLTFDKQRYTSKYLTFTEVENQNVTHQTLQKTTAAQLTLWEKYDSGPQGVGYPFISFGNKVVLTGPLYSPQVLHGLTWEQIASQLKIPTSSVAINIIGAANYLTAAICKMTGDVPASVCKAAPVPAIEAKL